jgi:hypothetical protein
LPKRERGRGEGVMEKEEYDEEFVDQKGKKIVSWVGD